MKRPFVITGVVSLFISAVALLCDIKLVLITAVCILALNIAVFFVFKKKVKANSNIYIIGFSLVIIVISACINIGCFYIPQSRLADTSCNITAEVTEEPSVSGGYIVYSFKGFHPTLKQNIRFNLVCEDLGVNTGDRLSLNVTFKELEGIYKNSNLSERRFVGAKLERVNSVEPYANRFYTFFGRVRNYIENTIISKSSTESSGLLIALLTGNRDFLSDRLYGAAKACGVSHILVVSGLHLSILCGFINQIFNRLRLNKGIKTAVLFLLLTFICCLCNFHSSAVRAAAVSAVTLTGALIYRKSDPINSLGFAVTVMVVQNPFIFANVAFLLSVFSTFGVIFLPKMLTEIFKNDSLSGLFGRILNTVLDIVYVSISALICVSPVAIYFFEYTSLLSPIVSIFINFAVTAALIIAALGVFVSVVPILSVLAEPLIWVCDLFAKYIAEVLVVFGVGNIFTLRIGKEYTYICAAVSAALVAIIYITYKKILAKGRGERECQSVKEP